MINADIYPNPCHGVLNITFTAAKPFAGHPEIRIYNVSGLLVREYHLSGDRCAITWSGDDSAGRKVPEGVYFVRLQKQSGETTHKVVFLR
jgi:flagellar hook assembly protein FlgD